MFSRKKLVTAGAVLAALGSTLTIGLVGNSPAQADPPIFRNLSTYAGVGSDTTQDITNAFAGFSNGIFYNPIRTGAGGVQLISMDATTSAGDPACVATKLGGAAFTRPNGSSAGQRALSRSIANELYGSGTCSVLMTGLVDFARSSSLRSDAGTQLSYVPMARDGLSFAYYREAGDPVTELTYDQIKEIYTEGELIVDRAAPLDDVRIIPCAIQDASGTWQTWILDVLALGANLAAAEATATAASAECIGLGSPARLQENEGPSLIAKGNAAADGTQVIIGFSAAAFVGKANGVGTPNPGVVRLGSISNDGTGANIGAPVTFNAGQPVGKQWAPVASFYNNARFGRTVFNVVSASRINPALPTQNPDFRAMFKDDLGTPAVNESAVCNRIPQLPEYGFTVAPDCGDSTKYIRGYRSGNL